MRGSLRGYVVRVDTWEPIGGATILGRESGLGPATDESWEHDPHLVALTDSAGRFTFDYLLEGHWLLRTQGSVGEALGETTVHVLDNALTEVTIEVGESPRTSRRSAPVRRTNKGEKGMSGSVRGRVVRAQDGKPVSDAAITVVRGASPAPDIAPLTNAAGWFVLDGLPAGDWLLRALGPGGETGESTVRVSAGSVADAVIKVVGGGALGVPEHD